MDENQTVDSVREAELLSKLQNQHIVKVNKFCFKFDKHIVFLCLVL